MPAQIAVEGYDMYWVPVESHGVGSMTRGASEAVGDDAFAIRLAGAKISFERNESGAVVALVLDQAGNETRGIKKKRPQ